MSCLAQNLMDSVCAAVDTPPHNRLQEVAICFGGKLLRGNRAQKVCARAGLPDVKGTGRVAIQSSRRSGTWAPAAYVAVVARAAATMRATVCVQP